MEMREATFVFKVSQMNVCLWEIRTMFNIRAKSRSLSFILESLFGRLNNRHCDIIMPKYCINLIFFSLAHCIQRQVEKE